MINNPLYAGNSDSFMKFSVTIEDIPNRMFQMLVCLRDFSEKKATAVPLLCPHPANFLPTQETAIVSFTSLSFNFLVTKVKQVIAREHPGALKSYFQHSPRPKPIKKKVPKHETKN